MNKPIHPDYTGEYATAGKLAQQLIERAEEIKGVVSDARAQIASQRKADVLAHSSEALRKDGHKKGNQS